MTIFVLHTRHPNVLTPVTWSYRLHLRRYYISPNRRWRLQLLLSFDMYALLLCRRGLIALFLYLAVASAHQHYSAAALRHAKYSQRIHPDKGEKLTMHKYSRRSQRTAKLTTSFSLQTEIIGTILTPSSLRLQDGRQKPRRSIKARKTMAS